MEVLEIRLEVQGVLRKVQRLTATQLHAEQPRRGRDSARWSRPPVLRAVDGEIVLCVSEALHGYVCRGGETVDVFALSSAMRPDPDFPGCSVLPIPRDAITVVERRAGTLKLRWVDGPPTVLSPETSSSLDHPYWRSFGFSAFAHSALVLTLMVLPIVEKEPEKVPWDPSSVAAFLPFTPVRPQPAPNAQGIQSRSADRSRRREPRRALPGGDPTDAIQRMEGALRRVLNSPLEGLSRVKAFQWPLQHTGGTRIRGLLEGPRGGFGDGLDGNERGGPVPQGAPEIFIDGPRDRPPGLSGPRFRKPRDGVELEVPELADSLPKALVKKVVDLKRAQVRACYERALHADHGLRGRILMRWLVGRDGRVSTVRAEHSTLRDPAVAECLKSRIASWRFPAPAGGGTVEVRYPFVFQSYF
ncbi:MAG: AgmX/PglI C-terminal domain-containing protein [Myxococcota bacterium]